MIGDTILSDGVEFEVVWDGHDNLLPPRETKNLNFWTAPKRLYNKTSDYWNRPKTGEPKSLTMETIVVIEGEPNER